MNGFDLSILQFFNQFAQKCFACDTAINFINNSHLFKGGLMMFFFWGLWFSRVDNIEENRWQLGRVLIATILGLFIAKALAFTLPFRPRPNHLEGFDFILPHSVNPKTLEFWSSFPSDHAAFFLMLALGFFSISKPIGRFCLIYTLVVILIPRVYLGFHYPTDIVGGLIVGTAVFQITKWHSVFNILLKPASLMKQKHPGLFYSIFFLITYQSAVLFNDLRNIGEYTRKFIQMAFGL